MAIARYAETLDDDQNDARSREREVLSEALMLIGDSEANPEDMMRRHNAIQYNARIWSFFLQDLADPENQNADQLKASIISIGISVLRHLQTMREDETADFSMVRFVNEAVLKGLQQEPA